MPLVTLARTQEPGASPETLDGKQAVDMSDSKHQSGRSAALRRVLRTSHQVCGSLLVEELEAGPFCFSALFDPASG